MWSWRLLVQNGLFFVSRKGKYMGSYGFICFVHIIIIIIIHFPVIIWSNRILGYGQIRGIDTTNQLVKQNCLLSYQHLRNHSAGWLVKVNRSAGIWVFVHQGWTRAFLDHLSEPCWEVMMRDDDAGGGGEQTMAETTDTLFANVFFYSKRGGFPANLAYLPKELFFCICSASKCKNLHPCIWTNSDFQQMSCIQTFSLCVFVNGVAQR